MPPSEPTNPLLWLSSIKRVFIEIFEKENDLQVKNEIASQLVALDEGTFISFLTSSMMDVRELVLQEIVNNPGLVEKAEDVDFLDCYLAETKPGLQNYYHLIFDQLDRANFKQETIDRKRDYVLSELNNFGSADIRKITRLSGLLHLTEGLVIGSNDYLESKSDYIEDILWMKKRLIRAGVESPLLGDENEIKQVIDLISRSALPLEAEIQAFEYLTAVGDISPIKQEIYSFFKNIMNNSDYRKQIKLLNGLISSQNISAGIILCNALSNSMHDSVREKAANILVEHEKLLCIETIRSAITNDPDFNVRMQCVRIIADKGEVFDTRYLLKAVFDPDKAVSKVAMDVLADFELDSESTAVILDIIQNNLSPLLVLKALKLLLKTELRDINTIEIFINALELADPSMKAEIISVMGNYRHSKSFDKSSSEMERVRVILEYHLVNDSFFETRAEAAICIGRLGIESSIPLLTERFIREEDFEVKRGIILSLLELKSSEKRIIDYYRSILSNPGKSGKKELLLVLEGCGMMRTSSLLGLLMDFFNNADYFLRWHSIVSSGEIIADLIDLKDLPVGFSAKLFEIALNDNLPTIRAAACWAISRNIALLQLEKTVDLLIKCLKDEDSMVREVAAESLGTYRSPLNHSIPELIKIINEETDPSVRFCSVHSLGRIARSLSGRQTGSKRPEIGDIRDDFNTD
ncbi:MAG: HEAT repeat domain-containing protein [Candidatus Hodarchaeales archaeon]